MRSTVAWQTKYFKSHWLLFPPLSHIHRLFFDKYNICPISWSAAVNHPWHTRLDTWIIFTERWEQVYNVCLCFWKRAGTNRCVLLMFLQICYVCASWCWSNGSCLFKGTRHGSEKPRSVGLAQHQVTVIRKYTAEELSLSRVVTLSLKLPGLLWKLCAFKTDVEFKMSSSLSIFTEQTSW